MTSRTKTDNLCKWMDSRGIAYERSHALGSGETVYISRDDAQTIRFSDHFNPTSACGKECYYWDSMELKDAQHIIRCAFNLNTPADVAAVRRYEEAKAAAAVEAEARRIKEHEHFLAEQSRVSSGQSELEQFLARFPEHKDRIQRVRKKKGLAAALAAAQSISKNG